MHVSLHPIFYPTQSYFIVFTFFKKRDTQIFCNETNLCIAIHFHLIEIHKPIISYLKTKNHAKITFSMAQRNFT